jgi:hypothetical protein
MTPDERERCEQVAEIVCAALAHLRAGLAAHEDAGGALPDHTVKVLMTSEIGGPAIDVSVWPPTVPAVTQRPVCCRALADPDHPDKFTLIWDDT